MMMMGPTNIGPVYDAQRKRLVLVQPGWPQAKLVLGHHSDQWQRVELTGVPTGAHQLLVEPDGQALLAARGGFFRVGQPAPAQVKPLEIFGWKIPTLGGSELFRAAGPSPPSPVGDSVAISRELGAVFAWDGRVLTRFEPGADGNYQVAQSAQLASQQRQAVLAAGGSTVLLAGVDGRIQVVDAKRLVVKQQWTPAGRNRPRYAVAAPGGNWLAVLFHHRRMWLYDAQRQRAAQVELPDPDDVSAVGFGGPNQLLVADRINRVSRYRLPDGRLEQRCTPPPTTMESVYRYVIQPVYAMFPKPSEMDSSITYLLTERETMDMQAGPRGDPNSAQIKIDPWAPVWSSLAFVAVTLAAACVYLQRQDF